MFQKQIKTLFPMVLFQMNLYNYMYSVFPQFLFDTGNWKLSQKSNQFLTLWEKRTILRCNWNLSKFRNHQCKCFQLHFRTRRMIQQVTNPDIRDYCTTKSLFYSITQSHSVCWKTFLRKSDCLHVSKGLLLIERWHAILMQHCQRLF